MLYLVTPRLRGEAISVDKNHRNISIGVAHLKPCDIYTIIVHFPSGIKISQPRWCFMIMQSLIHKALRGTVFPALPAKPRRNPISLIHMDIHCRS